MKFGLILSFFNKREKNQLILVLFAMLIMGFIELIGVGSIGPFISVISNPGIIHSNIYLNKIYEIFNFSSDTDFIIASGVVVIIILALSNLFLSCINFLIYFYSAKRRHSIAMRLFEKYLRQPYLFYLNINTSDLSKNILNEVGTFVNYILIAFLQIISNSIISLAIIILLVIVNPVLALLVSLTLGSLYIIIYSIVRKYLAKKGKERTLQHSLKYKYISETFGGIKDIKILGKEKVFLKFFEGPSRKFAMNDATSDVVNDLPKYLLETIAMGGIVAVIIMMINSGLRIDVFLPVLTVYAFGAYRLLPSLQKIFRAIASIKYYFPITEILHKDLTELPAGNDLADGISKMNISKYIKLEDISFSYPNTQKDIIKKQNITIESNTSIALVGSTGCGKTTLVDIILGLLEPQEGKLYIDNTEIVDSNRKNWQMNLGYVPQSIYLTDDTIRNNIAFGIAFEKINEDAVIKAAQLSNIHEFIANELPDGYNTVIGERGIRLSGGQRQRIGIARAVYHDPSVIILDEATSALDSVTENAIMDAIKNLSHKKTIIMIAHRITTVKNCDVIYFMEKGIIVDHGSYNELYQRNSSFRKMADGGSK
ncbi:ABC transporter ATP-binding protein [Treponema primitia]|uniref:ABC transporter ATP-binding protein n=1 Tax=Treponema primitia TaxID=88058 RepID=UPI0002555617|nr:ABC transporter ATP-binding protein [Treponema primitia]